MTRYGVVFWIGLMLLGISAPALSSELPSVVIKGLQRYRQDGAEGAVSNWLHNSPLEKTGELGTLVKMLRNIEHLCGKFQGYETAGVHEFTSKSRFVYLQLNYDSCPVFGHFVAYEGKDGWVITQINFNAKPEKVLPEVMLVD